MPNPYSPPNIGADELRQSGQAGADARSFATRLFLLLLANAVVPIILSKTHTSGDGFIGLAIGLALIMCLATYLGVQAPSIRSLLIDGSIWLAFSQFFPILQLLAGLVAVSLCQELGISHQTDDSVPFGMLNTIASGLFCTLVTGVLLAGFAMVAAMLFPRVQATKRQATKRVGPMAGRHEN